MLELSIKLIFLATLVCACSHSHEHVGDIAFDPLLDDPSFEVCNEQLIKQYYVRGNSSDTPAGYDGEKKAISDQIAKRYQYPVKRKQNGYVTIRFVVNCKGKPGRFRIETMDMAYQPFRFEEGITNQLLRLVAGLEGWIPRTNKDGSQAYDFYQYLTFKIAEGQLIDVLP